MVRQRRMLDFPSNSVLPPLLTFSELVLATASALNYIVSAIVMLASGLRPWLLDIQGLVFT